MRNDQFFKNAGGTITGYQDDETDDYIIGGTVTAKTYMLIKNVCKGANEYVLTAGQTSFRDKAFLHTPIEVEIADVDMPKKACNQGSIIGRVADILREIDDQEEQINQACIAWTRIQSRTFFDKPNLDEFLQITFGKRIKRTEWYEAMKIAAEKGLIRKVGRFYKPIEED